jgi:hypothetical protein
MFIFKILQIPLPPSIHSANKFSISLWGTDRNQGIWMWWIQDCEGTVCWHHVFPHKSGQPFFPTHSRNLVVLLIVLLRLNLNDRHCLHLWNVCLPKHWLPLLLEILQLYKQFQIDVLLSFRPSHKSSRQHIMVILKLSSNRGKLTDTERRVQSCSVREASRLMFTFHLLPTHHTSVPGAVLAISLFNSYTLYACDFANHFSNTYHSVNICSYSLLCNFQPCSCSALPVTSCVESDFFWWSASRNIWVTTLWISQ